ncbi:hypothetical protein V1477_010398 [Vespula maculifrons]|uniref:Uncharacterized protein n=2 Tax=Vespula TaxID=7451 RepID=A0A834KRZ5_VESVU|nr:hypothetical protein HZH66_000728 [Vespula vulgaris]
MDVPGKGNLGESRTIYGVGILSKCVKEEVLSNVLRFEEYDLYPLGQVTGNSRTRLEGAKGPLKLRKSILEPDPDTKNLTAYRVFALALTPSVYRFLRAYR